MQKWIFIFLFGLSAIAQAGDGESRCPFHRLWEAVPKTRVPLRVSLGKMARTLGAKLRGEDLFKGQPAPPAVGVLGFYARSLWNLRQPAKMLQVLHDRYGDDFRVEPLTGPPMVFTTDRDATRNILRNTDLKLGESPFAKSDLIKSAFRFFTADRTLALTEGEYWKLDRNVLQKFFSAPYLSQPDVHDRLVRAVDDRQDRWEKEAEASPDGWARLNTLSEMSRMALGFTTETVFQMRIDDEALRKKFEPAFWDVMDNLSLESLSPFEKSIAHVFPVTARQKRLGAAYQTMDELAQLVLDHQRRPEQSQGPIAALSKVIDPKTGKPVDDKALKQEITGLLFAGHDTTALAMTWATQAMLRDPEVFNRLRSEIDGELKGKPPTNEDFDKLVYLDHVWEETMRLYSPSYFIPRDVKADVTVPTSTGLMFLPAGSQVILSTYLTHRRISGDGRYAPNAFQPDRWDAAVQNKEGLDPSELKTYGFGFGPRVCVGRELAKREFKLVLIKLLQRFDIREANPDKPVEMIGHFKPKGGVPIFLRPRETLTLSSGN